MIVAAMAMALLFFMNVPCKMMLVVKNYTRSRERGEVSHLKLFADADRHLNAINTNAAICGSSSVIAAMRTSLPPGGNVRRDTAYCAAMGWSSMKKVKKNVAGQTLRVFLSFAVWWYPSACPELNHPQLSTHFP